MGREGMLEEGEGETADSGGDKQQEEDDDPGVGQPSVCQRDEMGGCGYRADDEQGKKLIEKLGL